MTTNIFFYGNCKPSDEEFESLWKDGLFAFDASVLLNLYRYSPRAQETFLSTLTSLKDRIWLPYRAAFEYRRRRPGAITDELAHYDTVRDELRRIYHRLESATQHPFIQAATLEDFGKLLKEIDADLDTAKVGQKQMLENDPILEALESLFGDRIGDPYPDERVAEITKAGKERYPKKIPPGYRDKEKPGDEPYGDLIIWNELMDKAANHGKGMVFVTDDSKEDWWQIHKGDRFGPNSDLRREMKSRTDGLFWMYSADTFVQRASSYLNKHVQDEVIRVMKDVAEQRSREDKVLEDNLGRFRVSIPAGVKPPPDKLIMISECHNLTNRFSEWARKLNESPQDDRRKLMSLLDILIRRLELFVDRWEHVLHPEAVDTAREMYQTCETIEHEENPAWQVTQAESLIPLGGELLRLVSG